MSWNNVVPAWAYMPIQLNMNVLSDSGHPFNIKGGFSTEKEAQDYVDSCRYQLIDYKITPTSENSS